MSTALSQEGKIRPNNEIDKSSYTAVPTASIGTIRYRHRALWLLGLYIPLLIIPWALTCVLVYHPVDRPSYYDQDGISEDSITFHRRLMNALAVLNSFASIITIPIVSALLAQGAVVYAQRRRKGQYLSIRQVFALADGGWSNFRVLKNAWPPWRDAKDHRGAGSSSRFLWLAAVFLLLCAVQQPLREALISTNPILVMTAGDDPRLTWPKAKARIVGYDAEPYEMATIPEDVIVQDLMNVLPTFGSDEFPQNFWLEPDSRQPIPDDDILGMTDPHSYGAFARPGLTSFAAALPNGTTTGVLRQRLMRLNSTVLCNQLNSSDFPSTCSGNNPFTASYTWDAERLNLRVCVPGQRGLFPWQNTRNRQDISEDAYLEVARLNSSTENTDYFTLHCSAQTARGYFEMGNYRNNYVHGPLLDQWDDEGPHPEKSEYNDWMSLIWMGENNISRADWGGSIQIYGGKHRRPTTEDKLTDIPTWPVPDSMQSPWPFVPGTDNENRTASGPLMSSMVALFGPRSLVASTQASNDSALTVSQICESDRLPFATFTGYDRYADCRAVNDTINDGSTAPGRLMTTWLGSTFFDSYIRTHKMSASVFFANQAMLVETAKKTKGFTARPIRTASGLTIQRPTGSLSDVIVISVFILLQLLGLLYLAWYIYSVPTWTDMLDALAVARITSSLDRGSISGVGSLDSNDMDRLNQMEGLIGVVSGVNEEPPTDVFSSELIELGLGAPGVFHRRLAKFRMRPAGSRHYPTDMTCRCEGCRRRRARVETGNSSDETVG